MIYQSIERPQTSHSSPKHSFDVRSWGTYGGEGPDSGPRWRPGGYRKAPASAHVRGALSGEMGSEQAKQEMA